MNRPFVRSWGAGPTVLCLHSTGSSSRQWDALAGRLADRHRVLASDLVGHGKSPGWSAGEAPSLEREVALLAPVLEGEPGGVDVVGHSYGAAVAMKLAQAMPRRVRSLTLFEPVMFRLLLDAAEPHPGGHEIVAAAGEMQWALDAGLAEESARRFVDYWSGQGAFDRLDPLQRAGLAARMPVVMGCFSALLSDRVRAADLAQLDVPVLLMSGTSSPRSARGVIEHLAALLPGALRCEFAGMGHMGPVTEPNLVNVAIEAFLGSRASRTRTAAVAAEAGSESIIMRSSRRRPCPVTALPLPRPS